MAEIVQIHQANEQTSFTTFSTAQDCGSQCNVYISDAAIKHLKKKLSVQPSCQALKMTVDQKGCSGYAYEMEYVQQMDDNDIQLHSDAAATLPIVVAQKDVEYIQETEIDYVIQGINEKLIYANRRAKAVCGCGESFSF